MRVQSKVKEMESFAVCFIEVRCEASQLEKEIVLATPLGDYIVAMTEGPNRRVGSGRSLYPLRLLFDDKPIGPFAQRRAAEVVEAYMLKNVGELNGMLGPWVDSITARRATVADAERHFKEVFGKRGETACERERPWWRFWRSR